MNTYCRNNFLPFQLIIILFGFNNIQLYTSSHYGQKENIYKVPLFFFPLVIFCLRVLKNINNVREKRMVSLQILASSLSTALSHLHCTDFVLLSDYLMQVPRRDRLADIVCFV